MCGRYLFSTQEYKEFRQIVRDAQRRSSGQHDELNFPIVGDIAPTAEAPVLIASGDKVVAEFQRWGIPGWRGGLMINARAETVCEKPMFRRSLATQRCLIPATAFYEWDAEKRKYQFSLPGEDILFMAGLFDRRGGEDCYCILTTAANGSMKPIHDRMPLVLPRSQAEQWISEGSQTEVLLSMVPPALAVQSAPQKSSGHFQSSSGLVRGPEDSV